MTDTKQSIETRIGKLEFTHDFANAYPTKETVEKLYEERDFQRACQAYIWALTIYDVDTPYIFGSGSLKDGPMVVEVPAASDKAKYFGTVFNVWDSAIHAAEVK